MPFWPNIGLVIFSWSVFQSQSDGRAYWQRIEWVQPTLSAKVFLADHKLGHETRLAKYDAMCDVIVDAWT